MDSELAFATIDEIARGYRARAYSVGEVSDYFLQRLIRYGPGLRSLAVALGGRAAREARALDQPDAQRTSELSGVPYGIKDMFSTAEGPPMNGSRIALAGQFTGDADVVAQLAAVGAVLIARLAMHEFGGLHTSDPARATSGATRNPWDVTRWSGGSSSGPGASVAAGLVPFAIGAESGGSIAFPSSYCGVTGLRPTLGRVSRRGASVTCWTLDKIGPMAHSAADCASVFSVLELDLPRGPRRSDGTSMPLGWLRIGWAEHDFDEAAQPETRRALHDGLQAFQDLGATLVPVTLPNDIPYSAAIAIVAIGEAAASTGQLLTADGFQSLTLEQQAGLLAGQSVSARDYLDADRVRAALQRRLAPLFNRVDALASFVTPWPAPPIADMFKGVPATGGMTGLIWAANLIGLPAVFMPCGLTDNGLPVGLQIVGAPDSEWVLLEAVQAVQAATSWHRLRPPEGAAWDRVSEREGVTVAVAPDVLAAEVEKTRASIEDQAAEVRAFAAGLPDEPAMQFQPRL